MPKIGALKLAIAALRLRAATRSKIRARWPD
jgi:hypothetical protein